MWWHLTVVGHAGAHTGTTGAKWATWGHTRAATCRGREGQAQAVGTTRGPPVGRRARAVARGPLELAKAKAPAQLALGSKIQDLVAVKITPNGTKLEYSFIP